MTKRIAVIAGDGIGKEVIPEGIKVLEATKCDFEYTDFELGGERYLKDGVVLTDEIVEELKSFDAIYLGAVGTPEVKPGIIERGLLLRLRFELDQYINERPFTSDSSIGAGQKIDIVCIRENTEGSYAGEGGVLRKHTLNEIATQGSVNTRMGVERCIRYAFEKAASRSRKHLTMVHKTNVLTFAGDLWNRVFEMVAKEYPQVETAYNHVDAACIYFVEDPSRYDVIVTDNLFGDILTDLGGAVSGGVGRAASANLNPDRTSPSMFEPVHGSAPDIAGKNLADPRAAIISAAMMAEFLGESEKANIILDAIEKTTDFVGSTSQIGSEIKKFIN